VAVSLIGEGIQSTWRKPLTCRKSLANFTCGYWIDKGTHAKGVHGENRILPTHTHTLFYTLILLSSRILPHPTPCTLLDCGYWIDERTSDKYVHMARTQYYLHTVHVYLHVYVYMCLCK